MAVLRAEDRHSEGTEPKPVGEMSRASSMWIFVLLGVSAVGGYWIGSWMDYLPKHLWFQVVYGVLSAEFVLAIYIFGVGTRSQVKVALPADSKSHALSFLVPLRPTPARTDHPLGPKLTKVVTLDRGTADAPVG